MTEIIEQLIIKKLQGECTQEEEQHFLIWFSESEENRNVYIQYKLLWQARKVNVYSNESTVENAMREFNERIDSLQAKNQRKNVFRILRYAAIFIALISLPVLFWYLNTEKSNEKLITETVGTNGEVKVISLPDGTRIWLNQGSAISYPSQFKKSERIILLEGEAFLEVQKDTKHPFIVKTNTVQVKVLGTSFNINTKCAGNAVQTTLVNGSIMLLDQKGEKIATLSPGQMALVEDISNKITISDVATKDYIAWQQGVIFLEKASIMEIIAKIEDVYKVNIQLDTKFVSQGLAQKKYNFVFRRSQSKDTVLEMLNFIAPVKVVKKERKN